jgi:hypothetical protein
VAETTTKLGLQYRFVESDTDELVIMRGAEGFEAKCVWSEQVVLITRVADTIYGKSFACRTTKASVNAAAKPTIGKAVVE